MLMRSLLAICHKLFYWTRATITVVEVHLATANTKELKHLYNKKDALQASAFRIFIDVTTIRKPLQGTSKNKAKKII